MTNDIDEGLERSVIEQAADAIIFADIHGVIRIWNAAALVLFGFSASEAIGQSLDLIVPEHLRKAHWAGFRRAIESGVMRLGGHATFTRALHKSGKRLYVDLSFAIVRGPAGKIVGSVAVARDATLRHDEEKARKLTQA
jgi:PAS domain S-box-containing protein